jgi:hypothetical protein
MPEHSQDKEPPIAVPPLCQRHQRDVCVALGLGPKGPWQSAVVITNIAMFQVAARDQRVWERCPVVEGTDKRDAQGLTMVLAEIGCLGCWLPRELRGLLRFAQLHGLSEVARCTRDPERMLALTSYLKPPE